jgi:MHS family proline/betaine transporter-like MFS transporter
MKKYFNKFYMPAMLGSSIEYYDIALYGYMAPVLVNVFLPAWPKTTAYFIYFLFEFFAALCQVAGARFYGKMGDTHGRKNAMYYAMIGTSCATFAISCLPTYHTLGIYAAILFASARASQAFFLGGEYNGGAIYCLEHEKDESKHSLISGLYCALTVSGIIAASLVATIVNTLGPEYFRVAYGISFILALATYRIRKRIIETPEYLNSKATMSTVKPANYRQCFIAIIMASLFFGMLYGLPTRILNALLPLALDFSSTQVMALNTVFLIMYMCLLVVSGIAGTKFGIQKVMRYSTIATLILAYPLMLLIETKSFLCLVLAKAIFATLTAGFIGPFHAWAQNLFQTRQRYKGISTAYSLGKCGSTLLLASSFLIYERYQSLTSIGLILMLAALLALTIFPKKKELEVPATDSRSL